MSQRHSPRVTNRGVAARLAHRPQPSHAVALVSRRRRTRLPTRRRSAPKPKPSNAYADDRSPEAMLGHHRHDMGVMVLHRDPRQAQALRIPGRQEVGMETWAPSSGSMPNNRRWWCNASPKGGEGFVVVEVAEVLWDTKPAHRRRDRTSTGAPLRQPMSGARPSGAATGRAPIRELGAAPRALRSRTAATESSHRAITRRSCTKNAVRQIAELMEGFCSSMQIGSSLRLPLVITKTEGPRLPAGGGALVWMAA